MCAFLTVHVFFVAIVQFFVCAFLIIVHVFFVVIVQFFCVCAFLIDMHKQSVHFNVK